MSSVIRIGTWNCAASRISRIQKLRPNSFSPREMTSFIIMEFFCVTASAIYFEVFNQWLEVCRMPIIGLFDGKNYGIGVSFCATGFVNILLYVRCWPLKTWENHNTHSFFFLCFRIFMRKDRRSEPGNRKSGYRATLQISLRPTFWTGNPHIRYCLEIWKYFAFSIENTSQLLCMLPTKPQNSPVCPSAAENPWRG